MVVVDYLVERRKKELRRRLSGARLFDLFPSPPMSLARTPPPLTAEAIVPTVNGAAGNKNLACKCFFTAVCADIDPPQS